MTQSSSSDSAQSGDGETRTLTLIRKIESGTVDPKTISVSDRRQLVALLMADGYATAEMTQVLGVADRTIERDKKAIRESNAIARDPKLVEQMVGRLVGEAELSVQRIRKVSRDKTVAPAVRVDAEHRCYQIVTDLIQSLQRLGYLPTAAQKVEADLTHHMGQLPDLGALQTEVQRVRQICLDAEGTVPPDVARLERQIIQADLASQVDELTSNVEREDDKGDEDE